MNDGNASSRPADRRRDPVFPLLVLQLETNHNPACSKRIKIVTPSCHAVLLRQRSGFESITILKGRQRSGRLFFCPLEKLPWFLDPHCNENPIYVFLFWELRGFSPNFLIHTAVSDLYMPRIGPYIFPKAE